MPRLQIPTLLELATAPGVRIEAQILSTPEPGVLSRVAFCWHGNAEPPLAITDLLLLHDCTTGADEVRDPSTGLISEKGRPPGWAPQGVAAHTLIDDGQQLGHALHIEASVYWPECCGLHGFIRDGLWYAA
jgi:hypothetical protein